MARGVAQDAATLMATADERIERHRKGNVSLSILNKDGESLPDGTRISVRLENHAFLFGANLFAFGEAEGWDEAEYRKRFAETMNYATLPFYWHTYEPQRGQVNEPRWMEAAKWCKQRSIKTKGHPLVWNLEPNWLKSSRREMKERLLWSRVTNLVTRYRGLIDTWDVVNEPTEGIKLRKKEAQRRFLAACKSMARSRWLLIPSSWLAKQTARLH